MTPPRPRQPRAVVIGSGFGGIAAAIRLRAKGYDTTILEMRDKPGGRAYVYEDKGFTYDAGPTIITVPFVLDELAELAGRKLDDYVTIVPCDPYYRIYFPDGRDFDYSATPPGSKPRSPGSTPTTWRATAGSSPTPPGCSTRRSPNWRTTRSTRSGRWPRSRPT